MFGACVARALDRVWRRARRARPVPRGRGGRGQRPARARRAARRTGVQPRVALRARRAVARRSAPSSASGSPLEPADEALGPFVAARRRGRACTGHRRGTGVRRRSTSCPALAATDVVVFANELLDNLPFGIAEWDGERWLEVRVAVARDDRFGEVLVPAEFELPYDVPAGHARAGAARHGACGSRRAKRSCSAASSSSSTTPPSCTSSRTRPWLRTYRAHGRGGDPLDAPGDAGHHRRRRASSSSTHVAPFRARVQRVAGGLAARHSGSNELVDAGRKAWDEGAHRGDLAALAGRSRSHRSRARSRIPRASARIASSLFAKDVQAADVQEAGADDAFGAAG